MRGVASCGFEPRSEGVGGRVVGSDEKDIALERSGAVGQRGAAGDAGGQMQGNEGGGASGSGIQ